MTISSNLKFIGINQKHACGIWAHSEKLYFFTEKCWSAGPRNIMKISTFIKCSQNFIKLAEYIGIIIRNMHVNLSPFREVNLFHRKMPTVPALEISWNFNIFSKFTKFHQTCQSSSEKCMWHLSLFREVILFHRKMSTVPALEISWKFNIFFKYT